MGFRKISIDAHRCFGAALSLVESIGAGQRQCVIVEMRRRGGAQAKRPFKIEHGFGDLALFGKYPAGQIPRVLVIRVDTQRIPQGSLRTILLSGLRQNLGELLNEVQYRRERILITKAGKPVAALIDVETFDKIRKLDEEFDRLRAELAKAFESIPEADGTKVLDDAVKAARKKKAARR